MAVIWSFPGKENSKSNPFTSTLVSELEKLGHRVDSPSWRKRMLNRCDVIHLHWPQKVIQHSLITSLRSITMWLIFLRLQTARGARVIWTMHNIESHEALRPRLERWWMDRFLSLASGVHALSDASLREACAAFPVIAAKRPLVAPHWTYADAYPPPSKTTAAMHFSIAFLGDLKPYKGLEEFLCALEDARPDGRKYVVHGKPIDVPDTPALTARLERLRAKGWNLDVVLERLSDQEMADRLAECGLLVLPYRSGENSGLAVLAAERGIPILVSQLPAFEPLIRELGEPRVTVITPPLDHAQIERAVDAARSVAGQIDSGFVQRRSAATVVREISDYYLFQMEHRNASVAQ